MAYTDIIIFDLDGTLRQSKRPDTKWVSVNNQELIPGVRKKLNEIPEDTRIFGATNQGGVPLYKSLKDCIEEQKQFLDLAPRVEEIFFAPGDGTYGFIINRKEFITLTGYKGYYRKPNVGMVEAIISRHFKDVSHHKLNITFIGDREEDRKCAANANLKFILASIWLYS